MVGVPAVGAGPADLGHRHVLRVRVVDAATLNPLPGASLRVSFPLARDLSRREVVTSAAGEYELRLPRPTSTHLVVSAAGYAWSEMDWDSVTLPAEHRFLLERGQLIGGIVLDAQGSPVRGALVRQILGVEELSDLHGLSRGHTELTDDEGRWECLHAPAQLDGLRFQVFHPDHAVGSFAVGSGAFVTGTGMLARRLLEDRSAVMLLRQGITVAGKVVNEAGQPVEGARIGGGSYSAWTAADGEFRLPQSPPGPLRLVVEASGFAGVVRRIEVSDALEDLTIALTRIPPLRLRIVDSSERPLSAARVRSVPLETTADLPWHAESDAEGRMEWGSPPKEAARLHIARQGYQPVTLTLATDDGTERTIRLRRPLQVSGQVVDADTHEPINRFRIIPGRLHQDHHHWEEDRAMTGAAGRFRIELRDDGPPHAVRVEADGYYPAVSRSYGPDEEFQQEKFELVSGTPIRGVVRTRDGQPVADAQVGLAIPRHPVTLGPARFVDHDRTRIVVTDQSGRFRFQPHRETDAIYVAHEVGFAAVRLAAAPADLLEITLQDWSTIEGRLQSAAGRVEDRLMALVRPAPDGLIYHANQYTALTDARGRFSIDRVPPGEHWLVRIIRGQPSHAIAIVTEPGRTLPLDVAAEGRWVTGQVRLNPSLPNENWLGNHPGFLRRWLPALEPPLFADEAARQAWHRDWRRSADGRRRALDEFPFVLSFEADGRFRVEDLPPGTYTLEVHYHDTASITTGSARCHGVLRTTVTVEPAAENGVADPVDLGQLRVPLRSEPGIDAEPDLPGG